MHDENDSTHHEESNRSNMVKARSTFLMGDSPSIIQMKAQSVTPRGPGGHFINSIAFNKKLKAVRHVLASS